MAQTEGEHDIKFDQATHSILSQVNLIPETLRKLDLAEVQNLIFKNRILNANKRLSNKLHKIEMMFRPLVVVGPSGAGKGTLINALTEKHPDRFGFSVSYATRKPREGEEHGKHYFFVSVDEFKAMIEKNEFIEYCEVHGNYYGTSK